MHLIIKMKTEFDLLDFERVAEHLRFNLPVVNPLIKKHFFITMITFQVSVFEDFDLAPCVLELNDHKSLLPFSDQI